MIPKHALRLTVAATAEPVSLSEIKAQVRDVTSAEDGLLAGYLIAARQHVESATGRALATQTFEMTMAGFPSEREFDLPRAPAQSVTALQYLDSNGALQTFSAANYTLDGNSVPARIVLNESADWPDTVKRAKAVTLTFVAGYSTGVAQCPEPLREAIMLLAAHLFRNREATVEKSLTETPMAYRHLIGPYETSWL